MNENPEQLFTVVIDAQEMQVRFRPRYFADYGHFEFTSPHEPKRRIPLSETGYRSHFAPMWEIDEAPDVQSYARAVALETMRAIADPDEVNEDDEQLRLF